MGNAFHKSSDKLRKISENNVPRVPEVGKIIPAKVTDVYDGDTITVIYLINKKTPFRIRIRIEGLDTPEIRGSSPVEKQAAEAIKYHVQDMLLNKIVPIKVSKWDKYGGRVIGTVYLSNHTEENPKTLTTYLLDNGYAKEYSGKAKEDWDEEQLKGIIRSLSKRTSHEKVEEYKHKKKFIII